MKKTCSAAQYKSRTGSVYQIMLRQGSVCKRWLNGLYYFIEDMGECPENYKLKRLNKNKNFSKSNCVWIDKKPVNTGKKKCAKCGRIKLFDEFSKEPRMHFGIGSYCLECRSEIGKQNKSGIKKSKKTIPKSKTCTVCNETKSSSDFVKNASSSDGLTSECKECRRIKKKNYRAEQKKKFKVNGITIKEKTCCICKVTKSASKFHIKKTEADHLRSECKKCSTKLFAENRKNINFRIAMSLRQRLREALKGHNKNKKTLEYLGCSIEKFKKHLESKFSNGMSWENYGRNGWHIDHIKPISLFDLTKEAEIKAACHYTNLQPLWAEDNMKKGAKYNE